ncbi:hypothetical protein BC629DRAFT_558954 [Irpex lacteus]|nr:hypothetical protein BC629DRAFT_558954 [Irpex lacteus]
MNDVERELYREAGLPVDDDDPFRIDYAAELQAMKDEWAWVDAKFKAKKKAERRAAFIESLRTLELLAPLTKDQPELLSLESCRPGRTRHRYGWRHIKVDSHTLQSALPQGEHLPKCAEDIPSELFNNIIWHVNHLCLELPRKYEDVRYLVRQLRTDWKSSDDCLSSLKACSLVCRHWAAKSRQYMYSGSVLSICSKEDFEIALAFATRGCPTLAKTAILRAVRWIDVCQRYDTPRSFYHLLLHPLTRHRLRTIILQGPIPEQFPRCFVNTLTGGFLSPLSPRLPTRGLDTALSWTSISHPSDMLSNTSNTSRSHL